MLGQYVYTAAMTIGPEREDLFNEVYDSEHVPELLRVPGIMSISRYRRTIPPDTFYLAVYEIATPDVPSGPAFAKARDVGRWPTEVRPFTRGLQNGLYSWRSGFGGDGASRVAATHLLFARILPSIVAQPRSDATLNRTLETLASSSGVTAGAHYVDIANDTHVLVAGLAAVAVNTAVELVASVADAEVYAAIDASSEGRR
jgi:hypothetical protein